MSQTETTMPAAPADGAAERPAAALPVDAALPTPPAAQAAPAAAAGSAGVPAAPAAASDAAPRRKPRARAARSAQAAPSEQAAASTPDAAPPAGAVAAQADALRWAGAVDAVGGATPAQPDASQAADAVPVQPGATQAAEAMSAQAAAGQPEGAAPARADRSRRGRNRRRGRREANAAAEAAADTGEGGTEPRAPDAARVRLHLPQQPVGDLFEQVLGGSFDAEPAAAGEALEPTRRVLPPDPHAPKLQKVLAQAGIGSRRDIEQFVADGRITVNGQTAHTGQRLMFGDQLRIDGRPVKVRITPPPARVIAYHKPAGEVVTHDDPQQRPTVFRRLPRLARGKWQSVGRLDLNTEGLLLFTTSGDLANQLMHPRFGLEREYAVRVLGPLDDAQRERLLQGVELDGQSCAFKSIEDAGGEGVNRWYRVVITEGRNREVRRLIEAVGHAVSRLIRLRYGCVVLPRGLRRGCWVDLDDADVQLLRRIARPQPSPAGAEPGPRGDERGAGSDERAARQAERGARADERGSRNGERSERGARGERRGPQAPREPQGGARQARRERIERLRTTGFGRPDATAPIGSDDELDALDAVGEIPNPLQQTFDRRQIQQARAPRREYREDGPIPNPLQQTYDKRLIQQARTPRREYGDDDPIPNPLQQTYDKRFVQGQGPFGARSGGTKRKQPAARGQAPGRQPDPMQTAVGYIGADALRRKASGSHRRPGGKPGRGGRGR